MVIKFNVSHYFYYKNRSGITLNLITLFNIKIKPNVYYFIVSQYTTKNTALMGNKTDMYSRLIKLKTKE
jgi:hypothetical protein